MKRLFLLLAVSLAGCSHQPNVKEQAAILDQRLTDAYMHRDWSALSTFVATDYYASGVGFEWNRADLEREFPKIHLEEFKLEQQRVKELAPGVLLVIDVATVRETFDGQDISGRYESTDVWVNRHGKWWLLVEEEVPRATEDRSRSRYPVDNLNGEPLQVDSGKRMGVACGDHRGCLLRHSFRQISSRNWKLDGPVADTRLG